MTTKNYGAGVSGYSDPDGRGFETVPFQLSKPLTDRELNLIQDLEQSAEASLRKTTFPSGWLSEDFLNVGASVFASAAAIFTASAVADELNIPNALKAHVNGWLLDISYTSDSALNLLDLGASPAGAGSKRTDLVVLEVWRRLLSASPSTVGKSHTARIWRNGNVKISAADDGTLNYADDILDANVGAETTKRVQIQYRLRVVPSVDVFAYPYGVDDPAVVANSVPAAAAAPDGVATLFTYTNQSSNGDPGLWIAGDGNPANTLGTVDGYMYCIPLLAVFRRNSTAFDKNTNHNGGVASPGPSDRPDSLFYDILAAQDIVDLRLGVNPTGWNYSEILEKNLNYLLDNTLLTDITSTPIGGGVNGHIHLWADEIGITNAHGGDGVTTGDTPGAEFIGEFDAIRRRFSDRAILESVTLEYTPADGTGGGPNWANGDVLTIDPSALPVYPYGAFNWASYAPSDISFVEVEVVHYIGIGAGQVQEAISNDYTVDGLGEVPQGSVDLNIGTVPAGVTDETLYVRLVISYPKGVGLTKTPVLGPALADVNNPGQLPAGAPVLFDAINQQSIDAPHREFSLTYRTVNQTISFSVQGSSPSDDLTMPERVLSISSIVVNGGPAYAGSISISGDGYTVTLDPGTLAPGDEATVTFKAVRPFPQNDEQVTVYYYANAPMTSRSAHVGTTRTVVPKYLHPSMFVITVGSGSPDTAYPFPHQYVQMPGVYPTSGGTFSGDHELDAPAEISIRSFNASTGFLRLPILIPMVANPDQLTLERVGGDVDAEGRSYFKEVPGSQYIPNAFAESLVDPKRHRCVVPLLAELNEDTTLGPKGMLVMVLLSSWSVGTPTSVNSVGFDPDLTANTTSASVYRVKGNLLNRRSS